MKKRREFLTVAEQGSKAIASTLVLQGYLPPTIPDNSIHLGFTVTKKVGNSVVRNRVRRRLRAAAAEVMAEKGLSGWHYVLIGRQKALEEPFPIILRDLRYALRKVAEPKVAS